MKKAKKEAKKALKELQKREKQAQKELANELSGGKPDGDLANSSKTESEIVNNTEPVLSQSNTDLLLNDSR